MSKLVLFNNEEIIIEGAFLDVEFVSDSSLIVRSIPDPTPPSGSYELILNGKFMNPDGSLTLEGWSQDMGWYNNHKPRPTDLTYAFLQGDRDYHGNDLWPPINPSSANIWYDTVGAIPYHTSLQFGYAEIHHVYGGSVTISVLGRSSGGVWETLFSTPLRTPVITSKTTPPVQFSDPISINAPYDEYRVLVEGTLNDWRDGFLLGNFSLLAKV